MRSIFSLHPTFSTLCPAPYAIHPVLSRIEEARMMQAHVCMMQAHALRTAQHVCEQTCVHILARIRTCTYMGEQTDLLAQKRLSNFKTNLAVNLKSATAKLKHKAQQESLIWGQDTAPLQDTREMLERGMLTSPRAAAGAAATSSIEVAQTSKESKSKDLVPSESHSGVIAEALPPKFFTPDAVGPSARCLVGVSACWCISLF